MSGGLNSNTVKNPSMMLQEEDYAKEYKYHRRDYLNSIRRTVILSNFLAQYFFKMIVVYLLAKGVTPWVAVSIPIVLDMARMVASSSRAIIKISLKFSYKTIYLILVTALLLLGVACSRCTEVYSIYPIVFVMGIFLGLNNVNCTNLNTQNSKYEPYCLVTWERCVAIGGILGYVFSQILYDLNPILYMLGFVVIAIFGFFFNINMKEITTQADKMISIDQTEKLEPKETRKIVFSTMAFGAIAGIWCLAYGAMEEMFPLITSKIGYVYALNAVFEIIMLAFLSGRLIIKIKKKRQLMFWEFVLCTVDVICMLFVAVYPSILCILITFSISGMATAVAEPLWASIISALSENNRRKYMLVNRVYFITRIGFSIIAIVVCKFILDSGISNFKYLAILLFVLIILAFIVEEIVCKKYYKRAI